MTGYVVEIKDEKEKIRGTLTLTKMPKELRALQIVIGVANEKPVMATTVAMSAGGQTETWVVLVREKK